MISFAAGLVDEPSLPADATLQAATAVLKSPKRAQRALQYGTTQGLEPLRKRLVRHIESLELKKAHDMGFGPEDVLLTTGSQQSLYLIADTLLNPGDIVITANPSYFVYTGALVSMGARLIGVPMDNFGMDVDQVARVLEDLKKSGDLPRVKFIYCTSFYQNPTGLTLSLERRQRLVEIARNYSCNHRLLIVEDAAYRELRYEGAALPSIKSFDHTNQYTVLTHTFSKPFAPGLKLGYTIMPRDLMRQVLRQKGNHDFGSANLCQWLALETMTSGNYAAHVRRLREEYLKKRDRLLNCLQQHLPSSVHWTRPQGGLYVWLTLPGHINTGPGGRLFDACIKSGVLYVPGEYAYANIDRPSRNQLRLCFGQVPITRINTGIRRLARAISQLDNPRRSR